MADPINARPRGLATRFSGPFQRAFGWIVMLAGLSAAIAGAVALFVIPSMTMAPLPPIDNLPRGSGIIIDVAGVDPSAQAEKAVMRHSKVQIKVKPNGSDPIWLSLDTGYFVTRDLERRCGLGDYNLDTVRGRPVEYAHDGKLRVVELRIGRVLCVKAQSGEVESVIGGEIRQRGFLYAPFLLVCGGLLAGMASLMLGLWDKS